MSDYKISKRCVKKYYKTVNWLIINKFYRKQDFYYNFFGKIGSKIHAADYKVENGITYMPLYMTPLL